MLWCSMDLDTAWLEFQRLHFSRITDKTQAEYTTCWRRHVSRLPRTPTARDVMDWHADMIAQGYSKAYANMCLVVLRCVVRKYAEVSGERDLLRAVVPTKAFKNPPKRRCPPDDLVERALAVCMNPAERAWILLASCAGLRKGELLGLRPSDWDAHTAVLQVVRQRMRSHRKNWRPHSVRIEDPELRAAWLWTLQHRDRCAPRGGPRSQAAEGYVFPWGERYLEYFLGRIRESLGEDVHKYLPKCNAWHVFRHWGATRKAREGATLGELMSWLGDASPTVAARYMDEARGQSVAVVAAPRRPKRAESTNNASMVGASFVWESDGS